MNLQSKQKRDAIKVLIVLFLLLSGCNGEKLENITVNETLFTGKPKTPIATEMATSKPASTTPSPTSTKEVVSPLLPTITAGTPSETPADELKSSIINSLEIKRVNAFAWAPDSTSFAISGEYKDQYGIWLYPVNSNQPKWFLETGLIFALIYTPDGESIVYSRYYNNKLEFVDVDSGILIKELNVAACADHGYDSMVFYGNKLFAGDWYEVKHPNVFGSDVDLWDIESGTCEANYVTTQGFLSTMELNRDGYLALNIHRIGEARNYEVQIWDINLDRQVCVIKDRYYSALNPAKTEIVVFTEGEKGEVWDIQSCKEIKEISILNTPALLAISPDGSTLAVSEQELSFIDLRTDTTLTTIPNLPSSISIPRIMYNQTGDLLAVVIDAIQLDEIMILNLKNTLRFNP